MVKIVLSLFSEISEIVQKVHLISENITQTGMQQAKMVDLWGGSYIYIYIRDIQGWTLYRRLLPHPVVGPLLS